MFNTEQGKEVRLFMQVAQGYDTLLLWRIINYIYIYTQIFNTSVSYDNKWLQIVKMSSRADWRWSSYDLC